jgi:hypothetical protein
MQVLIHFTCKVTTGSASQQDALIKAGLLDKLIQTIQTYKYWNEDAQAACFSMLNNFLNQHSTGLPAVLDHVLRTLDILHIVEILPFNCL